MRVEGFEQVCPEISVRGRVCLHYNLPLPQGAFTHGEEARLVEDILDLILVVRLDTVLHVSDTTEELCEQLLVDLLVEGASSDCTLS